MANICENRLVVFGASEASDAKIRKAIAEFKKRAAQKSPEDEGDADPLAIANFIPTPPELLAGKSPADEKDVAKNVEKYGAKDWYDWRVKNWGAKWDASDVSLVYEDEDRLEYEFTSPWSPHVEAFTKISEMFPALAFQLHYDESGMCFKGVATFENGITNDQCINY